MLGVLPLYMLAVEAVLERIGMQLALLLLWLPIRSRSVLEEQGEQSLLTLFVPEALEVIVYFHP
tara:strand:- start:429 stop:620 length:192 start_codon:yes stop_codon:yes gene_type:complete